MFSPDPELKVREPIIDLKIEDCSARLGDEPRVPVKNTARPLNREPARDSEPVRDLKSELCLAMLESEPSDAPRLTARPLNRERARDSEPVRDLKIED